VIGTSINFTEKEMAGVFPAYLSDVRVSSLNKDKMLLPRDF
jgi:hypothetical protein